MGPAEPVRINIYQRNTYGKDLSIPGFAAYLTFSNNSKEQQPTYDNRAPCKALYIYRGHKGSSFCDTSAKKLQTLRPAAAKITLLSLQHHLDNQVTFYIDPELWTSKLTNQKILISEKGKWKKKLFGFTRSIF